MLAQEQTLLKIGELAAQSGVPIKTIRYYEELGLLQSSERTEGHFRLFHPNISTRLSFIKRLQSLGLSLQEIRDCLTVYDQGDLPCGDIQTKLEHQVFKVDQQIAELTLLRQELSSILQQWSVSPQQQQGEICPNLQV